MAITEKPDKCEESPTTSQKNTPRPEPNPPSPCKSTSSTNTSIALDQSGAGIEISGYGRQNEPVYDGNKFPPDIKSNGADIHTLNKLSSDTEVFLRER